MHFQPRSGMSLGIFEVALAFCLFLSLAHRVNAAQDDNATNRQREVIRWLAPRLIYSGASKAWVEYVLGQPEIRGLDFEGSLQFWETGRTYLSTYIRYRITVFYDARKRVTELRIH
jgi:hypothetical protein